MPAGDRHVGRQGEDYRVSGRRHEQCDPDLEREIHEEAVAASREGWATGLAEREDVAVVAPPCVCGGTPPDGECDCPGEDGPAEEAEAGGGAGLGDVGPWVGSGHVVSPVFE